MNKKQSIILDIRLWDSGKIRVRVSALLRELPREDRMAVLEQLAKIALEETEVMMAETPGAMLQ